MTQYLCKHPLLGVLELLKVVGRTSVILME